MSMMRRALARFFFFGEVACEIVKIDFLLDFVCIERVLSVATVLKPIRRFFEVLSSATKFIPCPCPVQGQA